MLIDTRSTNTAALPAGMRPSSWFTLRDHIKGDLRSGARHGLALPLALPNFPGEPANYRANANETVNHVRRLLLAARDVELREHLEFRDMITFHGKAD